MKSVIFISAVLAASYPLLGQPRDMQQQQPGYPNPGAAPGRVPGPLDPNTSTTTPRTEPMQTKIDDKAFLKDVAVSDMMQVELGKLAAEKGSTDGVREFGRKMAESRLEIDEELHRLVAKEGVTVADTLDAKHNGKIDKVARLEGAGFDKAFLKELMHENRADADKFQAEANDGSDPAVRSFATRVLPMIQATTQTVRSLDQAKPSAK